MFCFNIYFYFSPVSTGYYQSILKTKECRFETTKIAMQKPCNTTLSITVLTESNHSLICSFIDSLNQCLLTIY